MPIQQAEIPYWFATWNRSHRSKNSWYLWYDLNSPSGQLSYTCCVMVATDADGANRNSWVLLDTWINFRLICCTNSNKLYKNASVSSMGKATMWPQILKPTHQNIMQYWYWWQAVPQVKPSTYAQWFNCYVLIIWQWYYWLGDGKGTKPVKTPVPLIPKGSLIEHGRRTPRGTGWPRFTW